jgi:predicted alpha/beta hydrolase family esterase
MNAIIFHGTKGSTNGNWFPWLAMELNKVGLSTCIPNLPTPDNQSLSSWFAAYEEQCPPATAQTILIGHSCGAVFSMRLLEKLQSPITATILVAPPFKEIGLPEYDALNSTFLKEPFDWEKIRKNAGRMAYFMGDNDPYVPQDQLLAIAKGLEIQPTIIPGGGHLNAETGYTSFPVLLELLTEILNGDQDNKIANGSSAPLR